MWVKGCLNDMGGVWKNVGLFVLLMGYGGRRYYLSSLGGWGWVGELVSDLTYPVDRDTI